jgi:hypothetical protein
MTNASAARLFGSMPKQSTPAFDIPILLCPACEKRRPMTIKSVAQHLRARDGAEIEYRCATCGAFERKTIKPA